MFCPKKYPTVGKLRQNKGGKKKSPAIMQHIFKKSSSKNRGLSRNIIVVTSICMRFFQKQIFFFFFFFFFFVALVSLWIWQRVWKLTGGHSYYYYYFFKYISVIPFFCEQILDIEKDFQKKIVKFSIEAAF